MNDNGDFTVDDSRRTYWIYRRKKMRYIPGYGNFGPLEVCEKESEVPKLAWRIEVREVEKEECICEFIPGDTKECKRCYKITRGGKNAK